MNFERAVIKILEKLHKDFEEKGIPEEDLKKIRIGKIPLNKIIGYSSHHNLIIKLSNGKGYLISPMGIDYLNNYKNQFKQEEFNRIVAFTGAILTLVAIYDFLAKLGLIKSFNFITAIFVVILIGALAPIIAFIINSYLGKN